MNIDDIRECIVFQIGPDDPAVQLAALRTSPTFSFKLAGGVVVCAEAGLDLWARLLALPHAEQMRCHTPKYGILINCGGGRYHTAAICWECNNISISNSGEYDWLTFDAQSEPAQTLLRDIKDFADSSTMDTET